MANIQPTRPYRAELPEGYEARLTGWQTALLPLMALGAHRRYCERLLSPAQWGSLLRRLRFAPERIATLKASLSDQYTHPLTFDEWHDLFEQLAVGRVLTTQYPCPQ